ncbi:unnamed protein product [Effrenium voratum]|uniref:Uncharacterized protein n=1 Tax=Effrenium voratum TaxID=2562239 RepID=A0AA36NAJ7_9DINO|nr:unnamed protein product [Effrenium voratum]
MALARLLACLAWGCLAHYHGTCGSDEVAGEIQGEDGVVCAPKCSAQYECPVETTVGVSAQPQCMLQNVDQAFFCGLLCQADAQCPSGASCRKVGAQNLGLCIHPLSFSDWARLSSRVKLGIGFPSPAGAGGTSKGFQIARAYSALQSLKRRYSISDGDTDVLTVKEMLAAASTPGGLNDQQRGSLGNLQNLIHKAMKGGSGSDTLGSELSSDLKTFSGNVLGGVSGWEREAESVVWNVEHIDHYGAAWGLLRGIIEVALIYLACGAIYKHQTMGARGVQMIPHLGFWMDYPNLVVDGVKYAQMMVSQSTGQKSSSGGFMPLGMPAERDSFADFEPSR